MCTMYLFIYLDPDTSILKGYVACLRKDERNRLAVRAVNYNKAMYTVAIVYSFISTSLKPSISKGYVAKERQREIQRKPAPSPRRGVTT